MSNAPNKNSEKRNSGKIQPPNLEGIRTLGMKENYKYLSILQTVIIKQSEMKEKFEKLHHVNEKATWNQVLLHKYYK